LPPGWWRGAGTSPVVDSTAVDLREERKVRRVVFVGQIVLRLLFLTIRFRREGEHHYRELEDADQRILYAFWHGRLLSLVHDRARAGHAVLISTHRDGEYIARLIEAYGFTTVRGSSTRGGAQAARDMVRAGRDGRDMAVTPDGPKGPAEECKAGVLALARLGGYPVIPIGISASRAWRLKSWDRFLVPKPFSKVVVVYGAPIRVPRDLTREQEGPMLAQIEDAMRDVTRRADDLSGLRPPPPLPSPDQPA